MGTFGSFYLVKLSRDCQGQSTIEFALTITLFLTFTFFFLQLGLVFAFGNYVQYATFMAARSYLSAGPDSQDQEQRARYVIGTMLKRSAFQTRTDKFPSIAKGYGGDGEFPGLLVGRGSMYQENNDDTLWMTGVQYTFSGKLFPVPLGRSSNGTSLTSLQLTSESWLGRDPTDSECTSAMEKIKGSIDNGC